jgi:hypothetical protein
VTLPKSVGRLRLSSRDPSGAPQIQYNFFDGQSDLDASGGGGNTIYVGTANGGVWKTTKQGLNIRGSVGE